MAKNILFKDADIRASFDKLLEGQFDPQIMIEIIPDDISQFKNVVPQETDDFIREWQTNRWDKRI